MKKIIIITMFILILISSSVFAYPYNTIKPAIEKKINPLTNKTYDYHYSNVNLYLHKGWNLIPLLGGEIGIYLDDDAGEGIVNSGNIRSAWIYSNIFQEYYQVTSKDREVEDVLQTVLDKHVAMIDDEYNNLIYDKWAIWIYSDKEGVFTAKFMEKLPSVLEGNFYLSDDWNLIVVSEDLIDKNVNDIFRECSINSVYWWDAENQQWIKVPMQSKITYKYFATGLLVKASEKCYLSS